jgi:hypothetical protein
MAEEGTTGFSRSLSHRASRCFLPIAGQADQLCRSSTRGSCKAVFLDTDLVGLRESRVGDLVQNVGEARVVQLVRLSLRFLPIAG